MDFVSISNQQIHLQQPVFVNIFKQDEFCNNLKSQLLKKLTIVDEEGIASIRITPKNSQPDVRLVHALKTEKGVGVVVFIKTPLINGMYFYLQGEKHLSRLVDPNFEKVVKTIHGTSFSVHISSGEIL